MTPIIFVPVWRIIRFFRFTLDLSINAQVWTSQTNKDAFLVVDRPLGKRRERKFSQTANIRRQWVMPPKKRATGPDRLALFLPL